MFLVLTHSYFRSNELPGLKTEEVSLKTEEPGAVGQNLETCFSYCDHNYLGDENVVALIIYLS
jgi:hypothetical protein